MFVTLLLEDLLIVAERRKTRWDVTVTDRFHRKSTNTSWTDVQLSAVAALAIGIGEEKGIPDGDIQRLYEIANPAIADFPPEIRPIP